MLKFGKMTYNNNEYKIFLLETDKVRRLDICDSNSKFNDITANILYGEYSKRVVYSYGDEDLRRAYYNTISGASNLKVETETKSMWQDGNFYTISLKQVSDTEYYKYVTKMGQFDSIEAMYGGIKIFMFMYDIDFSIDLSPFSLSKYKKSVITNISEETRDVPYFSLSVLKQRYDLSWFEHKDYAIVKEPSEVRDYLNELRELSKKEQLYIGYDYETTTLDFVRGNEDAKIVGLVLSHKKDFARYFPFYHKKFKNLPYEILYEIVDCLNEIGSINVAHNAKYEHTVNLHYNINLKIHHDTFVLSKLINPDRQRGINSLKYLLEKEFNEHHLELTEIFLNKKMIDFTVLPEELVLYYALSDADGTRELLKILYPRLPIYTRLIYDLECELTAITAEKEWYGFRMDTTRFTEEYANCQYTVKYLEQLIHKCCHNELKLTSSKALREYLYVKRNIPIYSYTKKGEGSTGSKALKRLAKEKLDTPRLLLKDNILDKKGNLVLSANEVNSAKYPECVMILKHRIYKKLETAFYDRFKKSARGNRYYSWISQLGTESGRESSPMHQLPSDMKFNILPDSPDHVFIDTDYSCVEIRALAWLSGQKDLVEALSDKELDVHRAIATIVKGTPAWAISKKERTFQKRINFGIPYLISKWGLAEQLFGASPTAEQVEEARKGQDNFMLKFRNIAKFLAKNREKVLRKGEMHTYFGRTRYFPKIFEVGLDSRKRESIIRQANNLPVQGTCADLLKKAQVLCQNYICKKGWNKLVETSEGLFPLVRIVLTIHDEILLSVHKSIPIVEVFIMLKECMQFEIEGAPPFFAAPAVINNFGEAKEDKYSVPVPLRDKMIDEYYNQGKWHQAFNNPVKDMLDIINDYRDTEIIKYMENLIKEHGTTDPKIIAQYAHHDVLTHELIARFPQSKEHKKINGELEHLDMIEYSVAEYMKFRQGIDTEIVEENEEIKQAVTIEDIDKLVDNLVYTDKDGNEYSVDNITDEDDESSSISNDEAQDIERITSLEIPRVWSFFDMYILDITMLHMANINDLLNELRKDYIKDGVIKVEIYDGKKLIDTTIRVNSLDVNKYESFIRDREFDISEKEVV